MTRNEDTIMSETNQADALGLDPKAAETLRFRLHQLHSLNRAELIQLAQVLAVNLGETSLKLAGFVEASEIEVVAQGFAIIESLLPEIKAEARKDYRPTPIPTVGGRQ